MRHLALACLVLATTSPVASAQAHKPAAHAPAHVTPPHQVHNAAQTPNNTMHFPHNGAMTFPNNSMNFPINGIINFPNNGVINFPNNGVIHFPNNGVINFPNNGGLNSPSNGAMNFPSYNSGINNNPIPFNAGNGGAVQSVQASQMAAMMGMPMGVGGITQGVRYHPAYAHHYSHPSRYRSVVQNTGNRGTQYTPTQRHYLKVVQDLDSVTPRFSLAHSHRVTFNNDLLALSEGSTRPAITTVRQLSDNLADAMARRRSPAVNTAAVTGHLQVVLNANRFSKGEIDDAVVQTQSLMRDAGFTKSDLQTIADSMHKVAAEARNGLGQQAVVAAPR